MQRTYHYVKINILLFLYMYMQEPRSTEIISEKKTWLSFEKKIIVFFGVIIILLWIIIIILGSNNRPSPNDIDGDFLDSSTETIDYSTDYSPSMQAPTLLPSSSPAPPINSNHIYPDSSTSPASSPNTPTY